VKCYNDIISVCLRIVIFSSVHLIYTNSCCYRDLAGGAAAAEEQWMRSAEQRVRARRADVARAAARVSRVGADAPSTVAAA
jgi:hypothetical protein